MNEPMNESPRPGWGLAATLKIILAVVVLIIAGGAVLWVLDVISLEVLEGLAIKTALVGGVSAAAALVLGLLAR